MTAQEWRGCWIVEIRLGRVRPLQSRARSFARSAIRRVNASGRRIPSS